MEEKELLDEITFDISSFSLSELAPSQKTAAQTKFNTERLEDEDSLVIHPSIDFPSQLVPEQSTSAQLEQELDMQFEQLFSQFPLQPHTLVGFIQVESEVETATSTPKLPAPDFLLGTANAKTPAKSLPSVPARPLPVPPAVQVGDGDEEECEYDRSFQHCHSPPSSPGHRPLDISFTMLNQSFDSMLAPNIAHRDAVDASAQVDSSTGLYEAPRRNLAPITATSHHYTQTESIGQLPQISRPESSQQAHMEVETLKGTIETLKSRLAVMERRVEYSNYLVKVATEDRDRLIQTLSTTNAAVNYHQRQQQQQNFDLDFEERNMQEAKTSVAAMNNRIQPVKEFKEEPAINVAATKPAIDERNLVWLDPQKKKKLKDELKQQILSSFNRKTVVMEVHQHQAHESRKSPRVKITTGIPLNLPDEENLPFLSGTSAQTFSLPANIQKVRAMMKQHDPYRCEACHTSQPPVSSSNSVPRSKSRNGNKVKTKSPAPARKTRAELLEELEANYSRLNREYDHYLQKYKNVSASYTGTSDAAMQKDKDAISAHLRELIRSMESTMHQIAKLRQADMADPVEMFRPAFSTSMPYPTSSVRSYSPSKSLDKLCTLRGVQKLRDELLQVLRFCFDVLRNLRPLLIQTIKKHMQIPEPKYQFRSKLFKHGTLLEELRDIRRHHMSPLNQLIHVISFLFWFCFMLSVITLTAASIVGANSWALLPSAAMLLLYVGLYSYLDLAIFAVWLAPLVAGFYLSGLMSFQLLHQFSATSAAVLALGMALPTLLSTVPLLFGHWLLETVPLTPFEPVEVTIMTPFFLGYVILDWLSCGKWRHEAHLLIWMDGANPMLVDISIAGDDDGDEEATVQMEPFLQSRASDLSRKEKATFVAVDFDAFVNEKH